MLNTSNVFLLSCSVCRLITVRPCWLKFHRKCEPGCCSVLPFQQEVRLWSRVDKLVLWHHVIRATRVSRHSLVFFIWNGLETPMSFGCRIFSWRSPLRRKQGTRCWRVLLLIVVCGSDIEWCSENTSNVSTWILVLVWFRTWWYADVDVTRWTRRNSCTGTVLCQQEGEAAVHSCIVEAVHSSAIHARFPLYSRHGLWSYVWTRA